MYNLCVCVCVYVCMCMYVYACMHEKITLDNNLHLSTCMCKLFYNSSLPNQANSQNDEDI